MTFAETLKSLGACAKAVKWVGRRSMKKALSDCNRQDWLVWFGYHWPGLTREDLLALSLAWRESGCTGRATIGLV